MNLTANKKTLALSGVLLGAIAAVLAYMGTQEHGHVYRLLYP